MPEDINVYPKSRTRSLDFGSVPANVAFECVCSHIVK